VVNRVFNLFAKDCVRATLADEPGEIGPEVSAVFRPFFRTRTAEGLAGARAGPDGHVVWPTGKPQRVRPSADPGEEVALGVSVKVVSMYILDFPVVHVARGDEAVGD
jgi:hypothetical protein